MSDMLGQLAGLERISRALARTIDADLLSSDTSSVALIHNAIDCIVERTHDSVEQFDVQVRATAQPIRTVVHLPLPYTSKVWA